MSDSVGTEARTIVFVNQVSGRGHLDLYARLYSACAIALGYRVALIADDEARTGDWLRERGFAAERFTFFSRAELRRDLPERTQWQRLARLWRTEGIPGVSHRVRVRAARILELVIARLTSSASLAAAVRSHVAPSQHGVDFGPLAEEIGVAAVRLGAPPALVFFLYLDMMSDSWSSVRQLEHGLPVPWAGILFHPRYLPPSSKAPPEAFFGASNCRGAAFPNPHRVESYADRFRGRVFGAIPDVTEDSLEPRSLLAQRLRERASGRTIVALVGGITPHKGLQAFLKVIEAADPDRWFFAIIGEVFWSAFGNDEGPLRRSMANLPENTLTHAAYVRDEGELNAIISASDILYAVYERAPDSSNTLTKASIFERPVLVSDDPESLMAERVRQYDIGATARYADTGAVLEALEGLRSRSKQSFGFAQYRDAHSFDALATRLGSLFESWTTPSLT